MVKCEDCQQWVNENQTKMEEACADGHCCLKQVCAVACNFELPCGHFKQVDRYEVDDCGGHEFKTWCNVCDESKCVKVCWWGLSLIDHMKKYGD